MIDVRREVINHIEVRWRDGFRPVSEAHGALADKLQELAAASKPARGDVHYDVGSVELADGSQAPVGILRLDVHVQSSSRELRYFHAAVFPAHRDLGAEAWRRLVETRYGDDPAARIQDAYEVAATQSRDQGGDTLERFTIREADVRAILGPPSPPRKTRARSVAPHAPVRALGLSTLVGVALGATLTALILVTCRPGPEPSKGTGVHEAAALRRELATLNEHQRDLEDRLDKVTDLLDERTDALRMCQAASGSGCTAELLELAAAKDKAARFEEQVEIVTQQRDAAVRDVKNLHKVRDSLQQANAQLMDAVHDVCGKVTSPNKPQFCKGLPAGAP